MGREWGNKNKQVVDQIKPHKANETIHIFAGLVVEALQVVRLSVL